MLLSFLSLFIRHKKIETTTRTKPIITATLNTEFQKMNPHIVTKISDSDINKLVKDTGPYFRAQINPRLKTAKKKANKIEYTSTRASNEKLKANKIHQQIKTANENKTLYSDTALPLPPLLRL